MIYKIDSSMSINECLKKMKSGDSLYLKNGIYNEKVEIDVSNISIIGESIDNTIISNKDYYHKIMKDYNECNTFRTYTVFVGGDNVKITNLTIENTSTPSKIYGQAVALHADGDNFLCENVILRSAQDTLFTGPLPKDLIKRHEGFLEDSHRKDRKTRQIYNNCKISGDVDFIFGGAYALFYKCDIISIYGGPDRDIDGYLCAPSHEDVDKYGYLFYKCNLIAEDKVKNVMLARPWRDYGNAAFIECNVGKHISPLGYDKWSKSNRDKTARFYEYSENVDLSKRVKWAHMLNKDEKEKLKDEFFKLVGFKI